ncbi:MAG TPA: DUF1343 domain-containing protein [Cryomorphaceae bacterium]|nr:hypothetical protein [Owenweeksia sp.]HCQ15740.1 DUF1343 domain-containing protein [Cryomorphaceae bacterium]|tara:strand:- start:2 stop:1204 length:1203 start_codon:yes stop_codon:yes gene_type:complete
MRISNWIAKYRQLTVLMLLLPVMVFGQLNKAENLLTGAERAGAYLPLVYTKKVAVVANQTSVVKDQHLVDYLLKSKVNVVRVLAPEHGFRGTASAGEHVADGKDTRTGLPIVSLYGSHKKPTAADLQGIDVVIFDLQDVGARFYTYISTMTYVMEACAENGVEMIILDRPNPHGYYVDGPVLQEGYESFVGMHHVPVIHGMTMGEYARMVNGEGWLKGGVKCRLEVVSCQNYDHLTEYILPVKPSPNLPNQAAVALYPSLCFFEGTNVSVGRGTDTPFQVIGAPYFREGTTTFIPRGNDGAKNPKYEGVECKGFDLREFAEFYVDGLGELYLFWLVEAYQMAPDKAAFFTRFFDTLAGTDQLRKQIEAGKSIEEIRESWQADLAAFKDIRRKYLLYPDFE